MQLWSSETALVPDSDPATHELFLLGSSKLGADMLSVLPPRCRLMKSMRGVPLQSVMYMVCISSSTACDMAMDTEGAEMPLVNPGPSTTHTSADFSSFLPQTNGLYMRQDVKGL